jgi:hypothetical protein
MSHRSQVIDILDGMVFLLICHLAYAVLVAVLVRLSLDSPWRVILPLMLRSVLAIGLTQILYAVPLCLSLSRQDRPAVVKGVWIGVVLTLFLNGSCFALFQS